MRFPNSSPALTGASLHVPGCKVYTICLNCKHLFVYMVFDLPRGASLKSAFTPTSPSFSFVLDRSDRTEDEEAAKAGVDPAAGFRFPE